MSPNVTPIQLSSFYWLLLVKECQAVYKSHDLHSLNMGGIC